MHTLLTLAKVFFLKIVNVGLIQIQFLASNSNDFSYTAKQKSYMILRSRFQDIHKVFKSKLDKSGCSENT